MLSTTYVQRHATHITLMDGAYHLGHHWIAHQTGKAYQFLFRGTHHFRNQWYAGTRQDVTHRLWRHIAILLNAVDDFI